MAGGATETITAIPTTVTATAPMTGTATLPTISTVTTALAPAGVSRTSGASNVTTMATGAGWSLQCPVVSPVG